MPLVTFIALGSHELTSEEKNQLMSFDEAVTTRITRCYPKSGHYMLFSVHREEVGAKDEQNPKTFVNETKDGPMRLL